MRTRKGLDWTAKFAAIADGAASLPDCIIDGEVVALDHKGAPDFSALQAALSEGRSGDLVYFVFDLLFEGGKDLRHLPLTERKERLKRLVGRKGAHEQQIKYIEHLAEAGDAVLKSACRLNLEGIISKRAGAPYQSGRTETWMKAKCRAGHEVVIGGWSGSASNLRSLVVGVYRGDHLIHTGKVGTGFMPAMPAAAQKAHQPQNEREPVRRQNAPRKGKDWTWKPRLTLRDLLDWYRIAIAKLAAGAGATEAQPTRVAQEHATTLGTTLGAVAYMSPEQARGNEIDARSDLFSCGVMFYEMTTGTLLRGATPLATFEALLTRTPPPPSSVHPTVPLEFDRIVAKLLEKNRELRCQTAADLRGDLKRLRRGDTMQSRVAGRDPSGTAAADGAARRRALQWKPLAAAAVVITATAVGVLFIRAGRARSANATRW